MSLMATIRCGHRFAHQPDQMVAWPTDPKVGSRRLSSVSRVDHMTPGLPASERAQSGLPRGGDVHEANCRTVIRRTESGASSALKRLMPPLGITVLQGIDHVPGTGSRLRAKWAKGMWWPSKRIIHGIARHGISTRVRRLAIP
jgi:hypothetical protein